MAQPLSLVYRGTAPLPATATDQDGISFGLGGLSGITHAGGGEFWAVMDNSDKLVRLDVGFGANGSITSTNVQGGLTLAESRDFEGIAYTNAGRNSVFLADEGTAATAPGVREYSLADGSLLQSVSMPSVYDAKRTNYGLESLARQAGGRTMWTANEEALSGDGSLSSTTVGSTVRLQRFDVTGDVVAAAEQYAYVTDPVHRSTNDDPTQPGSLSRSGLSDLVALPDGRLLALERSFARADFIIADAGSQYRNAVYLVDGEGASDVSGLGSLNGASYDPVEKTLLWSVTQGALSASPIGNLEGLALGPQLANGNWTLLGVVDAAGSPDIISANRLVAFELVGTIPEPASAAVLIALVPMLAGRRR